MQEFDYPEKKKNPKRHQKIVKSLLQGVFNLYLNFGNN